MKTLKKYAAPIIMFAVFEAIAITLWLTLDNLFYLLNFTYIGGAIAVGLILYIRKVKYARRIVQLAVGLYMLVYLGLICNENMQIEGFWYYLFLGVFEAATIHYAVAKIFGPLLFGRSHSASLTASEEFGLTRTGYTEPRVRYQAAYKAWHKTIELNSKAVMPFPLDDRIYEAPSIMLP